MYAAHAILADYIIFEFIPSYLSFGWFCADIVVVPFGFLLGGQEREHHQQPHRTVFGVAIACICIWEVAASEVATKTARESEKERKTAKKISEKLKSTYRRKTVKIHWNCGICESRVLRKHRTSHINECYQ